MWIVGGVMGMSMSGVPAIAHIPSMTTFIPYELMFNHAGKLRHMTGAPPEEAVLARLRALAEIETVRLVRI